MILFCLVQISASSLRFKIEKLSLSYFVTKSSINQVFCTVKFLAEDGIFYGIEINKAIRVTVVVETGSED